MAPIARLPPVPLQHAIWSRAQLATCKMTPLNRALAHALYRANYISWFTESGAHPPDASILEQFSPEELMNMHVAYTAVKQKRQLWMGLRYHTDEWKRENGWRESKQVPVMKTILSKSEKEKHGRLELNPSELRRLLKGETLADDMWRKGILEGQGVFLRIKKPGVGGSKNDESQDLNRRPSKRPQSEVLESREAVERGVGGTVICRVWPFRKKILDEKDPSGKKW